MTAFAPVEAAPDLTPELLVSQIRHLPSAPKVLPRLKRLLRDLNAPFDEIVKLIRLDPWISLRVLQVGNAAYFACGNRCTSVEEAVRRVGFEEVYELVAYAVASQVLVRPLAVYRLDAEELWQRSVACALAAEVLAERVGEEAPVAYTTGLLHAIGMVAIDEWALRHRRDLRLTWSDELREFTPSERQHLGFTHAEVAAALLRTWDFPEEMWLPLRWQHSPSAPGVSGRLAALVCAGKWLRSAVLATGPAPALPAAAVLRRLRLTPDRLLACLPEVRTRLGAARELVRLEPEPRAA